MIQNFNVDLAFFKSLAEWKPAVGDIVVYHGWLFHWFGIVSQLNQDGTVVIIKSGLPILLLTMNNKAMNKSKITVDTSDIKGSSGGKWTVLKGEKSAVVWHI